MSLIVEINNKTKFSYKKILYFYYAKFTVIKLNRDTAVLKNRDVSTKKYYLRESLYLTVGL